MSDAVGPTAVMGFISELFSLLDSLCDVHNVSKYDTAVSGQAGAACVLAAGVLAACW
jgi:hypothetical protein